MSALLLVAPVACYFLLRLLRYFRPQLPLPPGPKGYPVIGNILDIPATQQWKAFYEWSKTYGDVISLKLPMHNVIILNSAQAISDLMDKRSDIYSDRPISVMTELIGWDWAFAAMRYTPKWRAYRREFHQHFNQNETPKFQSIQLRECRKFLKRALSSPSDLGQHVRQINTAIILKIAYDMDINSMDDEFVRLAQEATLGFSMAHALGATFVDLFPILRFLPGWFPGVRFRALSDKYRPISWKMVCAPFERVKKDIAEGKANPSLAHTLLEKHQGKTKDGFNGEELARDVAAVAYAGAADTTTAAVQSFLIAMTLYPDVQLKAQQELDRVVGPKRLPEYSDHDDLVYIQAIALETMRWMMVLPMAVPHRVTRDDEYKGFFIPEGSTIIVNAWAILHDPEVFPDPETFNPERFVKDGRLDEAIRNPLSYAFGFGRRICPGRHLSGASLFMTIASILHTLEVSPIKGTDGEMFDEASMIASGLAAGPNKVPCEVKPRSPEAERLIQEWSLLNGEE